MLVFYVCEKLIEIATNGDYWANSRIEFTTLERIKILLLINANK